MCGRYTLRVTPAELAEIFETIRIPDFPPRYNITPTSAHDRNDPDPHKHIVAIKAGREAALMNWGIIPPWERGSKALINACGETVATRRSFKGAFQARRCLIPADG